MCEVSQVLSHLGDYPECQSNVTRMWDFPRRGPFDNEPETFWLCDLHYREAEQRFYGRDVLVHGYRSDPEWWDG
jgi:hypothetical protein